MQVNTLHSTESSWLQYLNILTDFILASLNTVVPFLDEKEKLNSPASQSSSKELDDLIFMHPAHQELKLVVWNHTCVPTQKYVFPRLHENPGILGTGHYLESFCGIAGRSKMKSNEKLLSYP